MKNFSIILFILISFLTSAYTFEGMISKEQTPKTKEDKSGIDTEQHYEVELIDNSTSQTQYSMTLKFANKLALRDLNVGNKILLVLPSNMNLVDGTIIPAGTKFSATVLLKEKYKVKFIINEMIFADDKNYIILSSPKDIQPLKTIKAYRILGKGATITGLYKINTEIQSISFSGSSIKMLPDTTTAIGICVLAKFKSSSKIKAGTPITLTFKNNIKPEIQYIK